MIRYWSWILALSIATSSCAQPQPRSPEEIARKAKVKRPGWIERLELSEEKTERATGIWSDVADALDDYHVARLALLDESIVEIKQGQLDRQKLEPLAKKTIDEFELALPAFIRGLNRLHALLNREERERLVEMITSKTETKEEKQAAKQERIARILDLNAGQKTKLYPAWLGLGIANLGLLNGLKRDVKDAGERFASEEFDAAELPLVKNRRPMDLLEFYFDGIQKTLPVLTEEQRQTLAAYLDKRVR